METMTHQLIGVVENQVMPVRDIKIISCLKNVSKV